MEAERAAGAQDQRPLLGARTVRHGADMPRADEAGGSVDAVIVRLHPRQLALAGAEKDPRCSYELPRTEENGHRMAATRWEIASHLPVVVLPAAGVLALE